MMDSACVLACHTFGGCALPLGKVCPSGPMGSAARCLHVLCFNFMRVVSLLGSGSSVVIRYGNMFRDVYTRRWGLAVRHVIKYSNG